MGIECVTLVAVSDTGPVIHLAEIDLLDLLSTFDQLLVPSTVYQELSVGEIPPEFEEIEFSLVEVDAGHNRNPELDPGERAALSLARERAAILLTDDLAAREYAAESEIEVHGSIGIIALGYARGQLSKEEAATKMRALQHDTSLFVSQAVVERGIQMLDNH